MSSEWQTSGPVEKIDADAVCARCGSVNPEETLLCKTCGNNLRDQRARRVAGELQGEIVASTGSRVSWVRAGLAVIGLLVIVWTGINADNIGGWLESSQAEQLGDPEIYWDGPNSRTLDAMAAAINAAPLTQADALRAQQTPSPDTGFEGKYALFHDSSAFGRILIGQAAVKQQGDSFLFVAILSNGHAELRGEARVEETRGEGKKRLAARETAGLKIRDMYFGASGFAQISETGGFTCLGLSDYNADDSYSAMAYRLPE